MTTTVPSCSQCGGETRISPAVPTGYVGPGVGAVLYHYCTLLEPDRRLYGYQRGKTWAGCVWMCDMCKLAGVCNRDEVPVGG